MNSQHDYFITTPNPLAPLLYWELRQMGLSNIKESRSGVLLNGSLQDVYSVCLWSRLANRVLKPISQFMVRDEHELYQAVSEIDWNTYFDVTRSIIVDVNLSEADLNHSHYTALKTKDAIVDYFTQRCGIRPNVDKHNADVHINVYIQKDTATLSLDYAGASLHRRGYRQQQSSAPIKENIAAAMLYKAQWPDIARRGGCLIDPMCGSGTLLIEAAWMAADIAPGLMRQRFGLNALSDFNETIWQMLCRQAELRKQTGLQSLPSVIGYDNDRRVVEQARLNITQAGLDEVIKIAARDIDDLQCDPALSPGLIICNAPYGQRLQSPQDVAQLYTRFGATLKAQCKAWHAAILIHQDELAHHFGLRAKKTHRLYNGNLPCTLLRYDIAAETANTRVMQAPAKPHQETEAFLNRLRKNRQHLGKWATRNNIDCYRLYDADIPQFAFAIDLYKADDHYAVVYEYQAPSNIDMGVATQRREQVLSCLPDALHIPSKQVIFKQRRPQKNLDQYEKLAHSNHFIIVQENNHLFQVNLRDYLDTGLFLDHRPVRELIATLAPDKRFLNLFAYTATAGVYAAKAGARETINVDLSNTYQEWAQANYKLNNLDLRNHQFIRADCLAWLKDHKGQYDLILLDPPTFSNSKAMQQSFDVQRDHPMLIENCMRLLSKQGELIFSTNFRKFKLSETVVIRYAITDYSKPSIGEDFKRNTKVHGCWRIRPM